MRDVQALRVANENRKVLGEMVSRTLKVEVAHRDFSSIVKRRFDAGQRLNPCPRRRHLTSGTQLERN
jgi:hypothetical protein